MSNELNQEKEFTIQETYILLFKKSKKYLSLQEKKDKQGFHKIADKIFNKHGITVCIHKEKNLRHNLPNIHIKNSNGQEIIIELNEKATKLGGKCNSKTLRKIRSFIHRNLEILQKMWNSIYKGENIRTLKYQIQDIK